MNSNSAAAYQMIQPFLSEAQDAVLAHLKLNDGVTGEEIDLAMGNGYSTHHKRLPELEQMGYVRRGPAKLVEKNGKARPHDTWFVIPNPTPRPFAPEKGASFAKLYRNLRGAVVEKVELLESYPRDTVMDPKTLAKILNTILAECPEK